MNLQISRKSTMNAQKIPSPDRHSDDQITLDTVLLYKLTALRVTSRARSERPPAGPERYTEVLGDSQSTQNFAFSKCLAHAKILLKNQFVMHGVHLSFSASLQIHFRNVVDQWHHLNVFHS